ncbi:MAG: EAL domain-containing protein, partial [Ruminococcus sp.]|nr:EAL domain-containing protein [Candidatus Apopatosoma intestinale]
SFDPSRLCLEFSPEILSVDREKAHTAFLDMKLLKVRTAVTGCGADDFPMAGLLALSPDFAVLDETATGYAGSRNKPQLFPSLVAYLRSMGAEVIAEGTEAMRKELRRSDCIGFIDRENRGLSLEEAKAQKEFES